MEDCKNALREEMSRIRDTLNLLSNAQRFAAKSKKGLRSKHEFVLAAEDMHSCAARAGNPASGYDGLYLSASANFELAVRDIIEAFVDSLNGGVQDYSSIPKAIRDWHPKGCASIIENISKSKFKHLTVDIVVSSLASCQNPSLDKPANLLKDAFSWHENNLRSNTIDPLLSMRLGIEKPWKKISKRQCLKAYYGTDNEQTIERLVKGELDSIIERRNNIIHRGQHYYTASETDTRKATEFFEVVITAIVEVLEIHRASI